MPRPRSRTETTPETRRRARQLRKCGHSFERIANELGLGSRQVAHNLAGDIIPPDSVPRKTLETAVDRRAKKVFLRLLGENLRAAREKWSKRDAENVVRVIVARCHIGWATYFRYENGEQMPDVWTLAKICGVLGVKIADMVPADPLA